jgi:hypothetical protein
MPNQISLSFLNWKILSPTLTPYTPFSLIHFWKRLLSTSMDTVKLCGKSRGN